LIAGALVGLWFLFINPPFFIMDENRHFYRAYQVSEGHFTATYQGHEVGGVLPESLNLTETAIIQKESAEKPSVENIFKMLTLALESQKRVFIEFGGSSLTSPVAYIPQALAIFLGRLFNFSPLILLYLGRLANFSVWLVLVYFAVKKTPILKWVFILLALMPMSLAQAASLSVDALVNSVSLFLLAFIFSYAFGEQKKLNNLGIFLLFALASLLALSKPLYLPLLVLFFLIPVKKIGSKKKYLGVAVLLFLLSAAEVAIWSYFIRKFSFIDNASLGFLFSHLGHYVISFFETLWVLGALFIKQFVGGFGLQVKPPLPDFVEYSYLALMIIVAFLGGRKSPKINWLQRSALGAVLVSCIILGSAYFFSFCLFGSQIWCIWGRYLIPFAPLFFILFLNRRFGPKNPLALNAVAVLYLFFALPYISFLLFERYYL